jgi:hypothetical protein
MVFSKAGQPSRAEDLSYISNVISPPSLANPLSHAARVDETIATSVDIRTGKEGGVQVVEDKVNVLILFNIEVG